MSGIGIDGCYVYLRDILTDEWDRIEVGHWADTYSQRVANIVAMQAASIGGELTLSGTAERGRATIIAADGGDVVVDYDWYTLTTKQARGKEPSGIIAVPPSVRRR